MNRNSTRTRVLAAATAAVAALVLAACGSSSSQGLIDPSTSPAPTGSASPTGGGSGTWQVSNCAGLTPPTAEQAPIGQEVTTGVAVKQGTPAEAPIISIQTGTAPATALGVADLIPGTGAEVKEGATVTGNYCGVGLTSGAVFDSSWARGQEASFGLTQVIQGWSTGLPGMKVGGTRVLVIPGALAYGANPPQGSGIGPDETLVFVVSLTATA